MAVPFRNLSGGNPYQGLANTMESVSSRVGSSFMSWAQAKRQRDERRASYQQEKEKSMVDAIVKLVPAAVGYEQQKDAFEYKKEQDKLDRQYKQSVLDETIASRQQTGRYQTEMLGKQQKILDAQIARDERTDAFREKTQEFQQFLKTQTLKAAEETRKHQSALLASKNAVTPLQEANSAATAIYNLNKSRNDLKDAEQLKWQLYTGQEIGEFGKPGYVPARENAPGRVIRSVDGKDVSDWIPFDTYLKEQAGYAGGINDPSLKPIELEPYLMKYGSQKVKDLLKNDPSAVRKVIERVSSNDAEVAAMDNFLQLGKETPFGPIADPGLIPGKGALETMEEGPPAVVEKAPEDAPDIFVEDDTGETRFSPEKFSSALRDYDIRNKPDQSDLLPLLVTEDIPEDEEPGDVDLSDQPIITDDTDDDYEGFGRVGAAEIDSIIEEQNQEDAYPEKKMYAGSKKNNRGKRLNIRVRSGPEAVKNEGNLITKIRPNTEVTVIGEEGKWFQVKFIKDDKEVIGWIAKTALRDSK